MKRKNNLYENCYDINNIMQVYKEVCKNTKNKKKVRQYQEFKCIYIYQIYETLKNRGNSLKEDSGAGTLKNRG